MREFALEAYFARWEHAARHKLTSSECETLALPDLLAFADDEDRARWDNLQFHYTDPRGAEWLRATIAGTYERIGAEDVLCFAGAQEGIYAAMQVLLDADAHAVVVLPTYQSLETVPLSRCAVSGVVLDEARGWTLDIDAVAAALRPNTRLVAINIPNNPTGALLEHDRFAALVSLCRTRGVWLLSDEVYRLIERDPTRRLPQVADVYERGLSLNVMSKAYGLPGLRIGWIACQDRALLARMERLKHYLSICNAAPSEILASIALKAAPRILARNNAIANRNLALLNSFFGRFAHLFDWYPPDGGVIAYPRYTGAEGVEAFAQRMIADHGVMLLPASLYASELAPLPKDRFRIGFGRADLADSLDAWSNVLSH
jgi:aspartate/methionine/tyrosine aminotransferase